MGSGARRHVLAAALGGALIATPAAAAESCPALFAAGRAPVLSDPRLVQDTVPLCFGAFAVLFSGVSRTPLYAAERLTRASVGAARRVDRADAFYEELRLPGRVRSELIDFVHSGYDRGHLAPAGDMPTAEMQAQSFSLANVVPQDRVSNRGIWAAVEENVRRLALRRGEIYVVTGPIFAGASVKAINARVLVPTQLYKAVYDPARGEAAAYLAQNDGDGVWRAVSIAELQQASGLDPFPALPAAGRRTAMALPAPHLFAQDARRPDVDDGIAAWAKRALHRFLRRLWSEIMRAVF